MWLFNYFYFLLEYLSPLFIRLSLARRFKVYILMYTFFQRFASRYKQSLKYSENTLSCLKKELFIGKRIGIGL